jgi:hypothetical protein
VQDLTDLAVVVDDQDLAGRDAQGTLSGDPVAAATWFLPARLAA